MPNTYNLISSNTVGSGGVVTVTFSSIPATYTDLAIKISARSDRASTNDYFSMKFNSNSSGYTDKETYGDGNSIIQSETNNSTTSAFMFIINGASTTANTFSSTDIYIPNYAAAINKSVSSLSVSENNAASAIEGFNTNLWANTAAITSISFTAIGNYVQYSTFSLYGVLKY